METVDPVKIIIDSFHNIDIIIDVIFAQPSNNTPTSPQSGPHYGILL